MDIFDKMDPIDHVELKTMRNTVMKNNVMRNRIIYTRIKWTYHSDKPG